MLIAQLTDTHVTRPGTLSCGRVDTAALLRRAVAAVAALSTPPDLLLLSGDLVDAGDPAEYALLREILNPLQQLPWLVLPGNHDERSAMRAAFPEQPWAEDCAPFLQQSRTLGPLQLISLDTVCPGHGGGELCAQRLDWLDRALSAAAGRPTLLALHHPPFESGLREMDETLGLREHEAFAAVVARHQPQVQLIVCGHLHRTVQATVGGSRATSAPSTAHQITLDLQRESAASFCLEPPGFLLHRWTPRQGFVSLAASIGPHPGPYPF